MANEKLIKVWDPLVRIVHWALVATFFTAYFTGEEGPEIHEWMGYVVLALVIFILSFTLAPVRISNGF